MKKGLYILLLIALLIGVMAAYWYFLMRTPSQAPANQNPSTGFSPFDRNPAGSNPSGTNQPSTAGNTGTTTTGIPAKLPALRLLSDAPVGGYGASTTASTTIVRWIDRGRGNIYEVSENSAALVTLSNTVLPRMYESVWNKSLNAFIGSIIDPSGSQSTVYAQIQSRATSSSATSTKPASGNDVFTPFQLKGKDLPDGMIGYAISPKKDKIFMFIDENGNGVGYTATFDGKSVTRIFSTPLTKVNIDWPEDNTIAITTKGAAAQSGFLYFVDPKKGTWKKILGPISGLSARVSRDAKYVVYSSSNAGGTMSTNILTVATQAVKDTLLRTIADKCVWGNFYKSTVYCAAPSRPAQAVYPDDWYKGNVSFADKIWQVDAVTSEVHLISSIVDQSDRIIDAYHLGLDSRDDYLFFMNKNDLSLWSLDLVSSQ